MNFTAHVRAGALLSAIALCFSATARADTVVVTAGRMLDVVAGRTVEHPKITITDGRITAVSASSASIPAGARHVDLPGMTLLPGLIDMHTHLTSDPHYSGYRYLEFTIIFGPWSGFRMLRRRSRLASPRSGTSVRRITTTSRSSKASNKG